MKPFYKISLFFLLFCLGSSISKGLTGDFSVRHLLPPAPAGSIGYAEEEPPEGALSQKYRYLGRGKQAHVFVSEDERHVLKVFKPFFPEGTITLLGKKWPIRVSKLPLAKDVVSLFYQEQISKQKERDFQSYINAFTLLKEETALTYLHLEKTSHLQTKLKVYDKIGIERTLDLDSSCFLLQKKTAMFYPSLAKFIQLGKDEEAKKLITSYVLLTSNVLKKGIINPTTVENNFGSIGTQAMQIDVGRILTKENIPPSKNSLAASLKPLKQWIEKKAPHLQEHLQEITDQHQEDLQ